MDDCAGKLRFRFSKYLLDSTSAPHRRVGYMHFCRRMNCRCALDHKGKRKGALSRSSHRGSPE